MIPEGSIYTDENTDNAGTHRPQTGQEAWRTHGAVTATEAQRPRPAGRSLKTGTRRLRPPSTQGAGQL